jgi:hypothetical protein
VDVIQAYNNGELDTKPAFIPDRGSDRSTNDSSQKDPDEETSTKQKDKKGNPRIYAKAPSMSNAPGSPKAFEPSVVETTKNSVHFKVDFQGTDNRQKMGYFLFELRGLGGREKVRIDLVNMGRWENSKAITPLYSRGVDELSDLNSLRARPPRNGKLEYVKTPHGQKVPKTETLQKWHYFKNVSRKDDQQTLVVRKRFPEEMTHTFFCHRIPYSYAYYLEHMDQLEERAKYGDGRLTVHNVGETGKGNPIHIVELENPTDPQAKNKPVVLLTAGEHPDEHDTYHAMRGVIEFLLKNTEAAENLRRKATFLVIPVLDPDGLAELRYVNICQSFADKSNFASYADPPSKTSVAIAQWIRGWINNGRRLSAQILIHNVEGGETNSHLFSYLVESKSGRHTLSKSFWHHVRKHVKSIGFRTEKKPKKSGYLAARLGGFLNANFGTFNLFVELNSQADYPGAKLTLKQIQDIGKILVAATVNWLYNNDKAVKSIEKKRRKRRRLYEKYSVIEKNRRVVQAENPFDMESWLWVLPEYEETYFSFDREMRDKLWISRAMKLIYPDSVDEKNESFSE